MKLCGTGEGGVARRADKDTLCHMHDCMGEGETFTILKGRVHLSSNGIDTDARPWLYNYPLTDLEADAKQGDSFILKPVMLKVELA